MNQDNHTGFFRQYFIACFQPGKYKLLLEKKTGSRVGYMVLLLVFLLIIDTVIPFGAWTASVGGFRNLFLNRLPAFSLEDGSFQIEEPISFDIGGAIRVELDSSKENYTKNDFEGEYQEEILVSKTNILIRAGNQGSEIALSSLKEVYLDNQVLIGAIPAIIMIVVLYFMITLLTKAIQYFLAALIYGLVCRVGVRSREGRSLTVKEAFLIAMYAQTLFSVISSVNASLGYMIDSFWLSIISIIFVMSYIFKAEVSVLKLEAS